MTQVNHITIVSLLEDISIEMVDLARKTRIRPLHLQYTDNEESSVSTVLKLNTIQSTLI